MVTTQSPLILVFALSLVITCSPESPDRSKQSVSQSGDNKQLLTTLGQAEKAIEDYYQSMEKEIKNDLGITEEKLEDHIQSLIHIGHIPQPIIFIDTPEGTEAKTVSYSTYKEFRRKNTIDLNRHYRTNLTSAYSAAYDSIRAILLKAFEADTTGMQLPE
jgi:hypothetical protein